MVRARSSSSSRCRLPRSSSRSLAFSRIVDASSASVCRISRLPTERSAAANHFARESHIDELAGELKIDPLEFRLRNIKNPRLLAVVEAGARAFSWGGAKTAGRGRGLAVGIDKGGHVATFAEVAVEAEGGRVGGSEEHTSELQ